MKFFRHRFIIKFTKLKFVIGLALIVTTSSAYGQEWTTLEWSGPINKRWLLLWDKPLSENTTTTITGIVKYQNRDGHEKVGHFTQIDEVSIDNIFHQRNIRYDNPREEQEKIVFAAHMSLREYMEMVGTDSNLFDSSDYDFNFMINDKVEIGELSCSSDLRPFDDCRLKLDFEKFRDIIFQRENMLKQLSDKQRNAFEENLSRVSSLEESINIPEDSPNQLNVKGTIRGSSAMTYVSKRLLPSLEASAGVQHDTGGIFDRIIDTIRPSDFTQTIGPAGIEESDLFQIDRSEPPTQPPQEEEINRPPEPLPAVR